MSTHFPFQGVEAFPMGVVSRLAHCYRDVLFQRGSFHLQFFSQPLELIFFFFLIDDCHKNVVIKLMAYH